MKLAIRIVVIIALAFAAAVCVLLPITTHDQRARLTSKLRTEEAQVWQLSARVAAVCNRINSLGSQVANLNVPSDPLSAYNGGLTGMTNNATGVHSRTTSHAPTLRRRWRSLALQLVTSGAPGDPCKAQDKVIRK